MLVLDFYKYPSYPFLILLFRAFRLCPIYQYNTQRNTTTVHPPNNRLPTTMDPSEKLSTPQCPAEHRAWLLIYQKRIGKGKRLEEAFEKQFWDRRQYNIPYHAARVRNADEEVQSQLLELAKQYSWYKDSPQEGMSGHKLMKRLERLQEARDRIKSKSSPTTEDSKV